MSDAPLQALCSSQASTPTHPPRPAQARFGAPAGGRLTDQALVDAIVLGDRGALAEVHRRHHARVMSAAQSVCDLKCAEEVAQDVFMRLWTLPGRFDAGRGTLGGFLSLEAHDRAVDLVRSRASRFARERTVTMLDLSIGVDPETEVLEREAAARVRRALVRLPRCEYEVIVLAYFGRHSYRDVAELLEQPEGTVKARIRNALARLRSWLDDGSLRSRPIPGGGR